MRVVTSEAKLRKLIRRSGRRDDLVPTGNPAQLERPEGHQLPGEARLVALGSFELRGIPGRHEIWQVVVPDLPDEFPQLRLTGDDPSSTSLGKSATTKRHG